MVTTWEISEKTFLITGGASGLGALHVEEFLKEGAKAVAVLDIAEDAGKTKAAKLNQSYPNKVFFIKCDVNSEDEITKAFEEAVNKLKQIDVIINNAGIMLDSPNVWRTACNVNWQGVVSFTLKGINHMGKNKGGAGGTIINISSIAALTKIPFVPIYNGSKMAVLHFSQCIAMEPFYENSGIRILTMCFGATDTPLLERLKDKTYDPEFGESFVNLVETFFLPFQKAESAVAAFLEMFKNGPPGSIWLSVHNRPAKNITSDVNESFQKWEQLTAP